MRITYAILYSKKEVWYRVESYNSVTINLNQRVGLLNTSHTELLREDISKIKNADLCIFLF